MDKEYEAYHSRAYSLVFAALFAILTSINILLNLIGRADIYVTVLLGMMAAVVMYFFIFSATRRGIAVEITDNTLVLYKKKTETYHIEDIKAVSIHDGYGSFDIYIKTFSGEKSAMHCFVKGDRLKKKELVSILMAKGVDTHSYDID